LRDLANVVLEGTARLYLPGRLGESTLVKAGQMIIMRLDAKMIPEPVDVDIHADNDVNFNLNQFPEGTSTGQVVNIDAGHNVNIDPTGDQTVFNNANIITVNASNAINITGTSSTMLNLTSSTNPFGLIVAFSAGSDFTLANGLTINLDNSGYS
jgi:hypothetical protein